MLRVICEIDDEAFGKCNIQRGEKMVMLSVSEMTADEVTELVLDPQTDLEQFTKVVRIEHHTGFVIGDDEIERVAKRTGHRQSKPRYSRSR